MFFDEELTIDLTEGYSKLDHPIKVYYQDKNINILITLMKDGRNLVNEDTDEVLVNVLMTVKSYALVEDVEGVTR